MRVSAVPEFGPIIDLFVDRMAQQVGLVESERFNLKQGVQRTIGGSLDEGEGGSSREIQLEFSGFSDRLELVVEMGGAVAEPAEANSFLLNQLLDRVTVEEAVDSGKRVTLVKYTEQGSQP